MAIFYAKNILLKKKQESSLKVLTFLIILNAIVSVFPVLGFKEIAQFSSWFGLGEEFHAGYATYRAFGIVGQPGVLSMFCNFCALLLYFYYFDFNRKKKNIFPIIILLILVFFTVLASGSRIGLGFWIINFILASLLIKELRLLLFASSAAIVLVAYIYWNELSDFVLLMSRGINFKEGTTGTLGFRLMYKILIFDLLSDDFTSFLFGIGPSREVLQAPLRHPDSSVSVYNIRYGYLGLIIYSIPVLFVFYLSCHAFVWGKNLIKKDFRLFLATSLAVQIYFLIVGHLEPAYEDFKMNVLFFYLCGFTVSLINLGHENKHSDTYPLKWVARTVSKKDEQT